MRCDAAESALYRSSFTVRAHQDVCAAHAGSRKDALATGNLCRELSWAPNATQRRQPHHQPGTFSAARLSNANRRPQRGRNNAVCTLFYEPSSRRPSLPNYDHPILEPTAGCARTRLALSIVANLLAIGNEGRGTSAQNPSEEQSTRGRRCF
jgi:hypothetical protein